MPSFFDCSPMPSLEKKKNTSNFSCLCKKAFVFCVCITNGYFSLVHWTFPCASCMPNLLSSFMWGPIGLFMTNLNLWPAEASQKTDHAAKIVLLKKSRLPPWSRSCSKKSCIERELDAFIQNWWLLMFFCFLLKIFIPCSFCWLLWNQFWWREQKADRLGTDPNFPSLC